MSLGVNQSVTMFRPLDPSTRWACGWPEITFAENLVTIIKDEWKQSLEQPFGCSVADISEDVINAGKTNNNKGR